MKTPIIKAIFIFFSLSVSAQTPELDSLILNLNNHPAKDSTRAQLLLDIAIKLRRINPNEAIPYYADAFETAEKAGVFTIQSKANNGMAICYGMMGEYPSAIEYFQRTIEISKPINDLTRVADGYNGLGVVYKRLGDYPQSLVYYTQALATYDSAKDIMGLAAAYANVGVLYDLMKEPVKALEYYQKAIAIYTKENNPLQVSIAKSNIGVLYVDEKRYDEALEIFKYNLRVYDSLKRDAEAINTSNNIAHVYVKQGKYADADVLLKKNLQLAKELSMKQEQTSIYSNLVEVALATGDLDDAIRYANEHLNLVLELKSKYLLAEAYEVLSRVYEKRREYSKALEAYKEHKAWSDSVYNEDNARAFLAQEVKIEVLEKNKQLAEQTLRLEFLQAQVQQETRQKWLLAIVSVLLLASGILFFQKFTQRKRMNALLEEKNERISKQNARIEEMNYQLENRMLRAQINPHFIFNSLSSIQHFITGDDKHAALKYLTKFSHLLRQVLESSINGNVLLREELKLLEMYLELEALRFDNNFSFDIYVNDSLDPDTVEIPTMILQPLIENAILHGLIPKQGDRKLNISFEADSDMMEIRIEDNGIGRDASRKMQEGKIRQNPSRGLAVTEQRLSVLREKYGWQSSMHYHDMVDASGEPAGTCVILRFAIMG
ncbi:tetratricopeptide repeat protein [Cytophagales bacterium LB-30]|uniref:Tetratricopeptide repeat protein n=1 Tax=Shiella aurantiaca TaxID=3058365 RepID=A0ABT8F8J2_9BACT|nr:tetratricopeptide repeat protein [Shiella aurantiaca]MDN4166266.1 tetratricopeptide repeat protein [Shiella aurantiaca]